jgi:hypothetical protein
MTQHDEWLLVAQDCDLAWNAVAGSDPLIELRPVFRDNPPEDWARWRRRLPGDVRRRPRRRRSE